jgi:hypothetical protein
MEFLIKKNMAVAPHPLHFCLPNWKYNWKAAISTIHRTTSRLHLKKWQKHWERCIGVEGDYFEGDSGQ